MNWLNLKKLEELDWLIKQSNNPQISAVLIFKHSTRCGTSLMMKKQFENQFNFNPNHVLPYFLDLITYREISNKITEYTGIEHQSPQLIALKNGKVIYAASHYHISFEKLKQAIQ